MPKNTTAATLLTSLICMTSFAYTESESSQQKPSCGRGSRHMHLSARHIEGKGIGYGQGYTTLETFLAPDQQRNSLLPFVDIRGHVFNNGKFAANGGLGLRYKRGCHIYGANVYYDYRDDRRNFNQVGVGLEFLNKWWDLRANGYFPVGTKVSSPYHTEFSHFKGHSLILSRKYEFTMKGFDAEVGGHYDTADFRFYTGAGPYYFDGQLGPSAWGGKARVYAGWKDYVGVQVIASADRVFHGIVQGEIILSLPFGPRSDLKEKNKNCRSARRLDRRMVQPVVRDEIIVLNKHRKHSTAINPATGDPYVFWFVDNTSHSDGTFESPFNTLMDSQSASGPNDIIYVFPGNATSTGMSDGIVLKNGQQLLGATTSHNLPTTVGEITITPQASSNFLPLIINGAGAVV